VAPEITSIGVRITADDEISSKKNAWQLNLLLYIQLRACSVQDYKKITEVQWLGMANAITTALEELMLYSTLDKTKLQNSKMLDL
jgi:hypothetical protein